MARAPSQESNPAKSAPSFRPGPGRPRPRTCIKPKWPMWPSERRVSYSLLPVSVYPKGLHSCRLKLDSGRLQDRARPGALLVGDDETFREIAPRRTRGINAHFRHREILWVRCRIENRGLGTGNEEDVFLRPHAGRYRPHHIVEVEDINVVINNDDVFGIKLGAEGGDDRHLRLTIARLLHRHESHERAAGRMRDVHIAHIRQVAS